MPKSTNERQRQQEWFLLYYERKTTIPKLSNWKENCSTVRFLGGWTFQNELKKPIEHCFIKQLNCGEFKQFSLSAARGAHRTGKVTPKLFMNLIITAIVFVCTNNSYLSIMPLLDNLLNTDPIAVNHSIKILSFMFLSATLSIEIQSYFPNDVRSRPLVFLSCLNSFWESFTVFVQGIMRARHRHRSFRI